MAPGVLVEGTSGGMVKGGVANWISWLKERGTCALSGVTGSST
jgi:hypothetical protein